MWKTVAYLVLSLVFFIAFVPIHMYKWNRMETQVTGSILKVWPHSLGYNNLLIF